MRLLTVIASMNSRNNTVMSWPQQHANEIAVLRRTPLVSGRERGADHFCQIDFAIRLRKQQNAGVDTAVMHQGVFRIAGRIPDLYRRPAAQCLDGQLPPVDRTRHHHVGEQKIDFFALIDDRQGLAGIARGKRPVSEALDLGATYLRTRTSSSTIRIAPSPPSTSALSESSGRAK